MMSIALRQNCDSYHESFKARPNSYVPSKSGQWSMPTSLRSSTKLEFTKDGTNGYKGRSSFVRVAAIQGDEGQDKDSGGLRAMYHNDDSE